MSDVDGADPMNETVDEGQPSEEELPLKRPLYFVTTVFYFGAIAVIVSGLLFGGGDLWVLAQSGGVGMLVSVPIVWWLTGRNSGFTGLPPSNLGFLFGVLLVAGIGFPTFSLIDMETSFVAFIILVIIALAAGRYFEGLTEQRFGHLWGTDLDDDTDESADTAETEQTVDDAADETGTGTDDKMDETDAAPDIGIDGTNAGEDDALDEPTAERDTNGPDTEAASAADTMDDEGERDSADGSATDR